MTKRMKEDIAEIAKEMKTEDLLRCLSDEILVCIELKNKLTINSEIGHCLERAYALTINELKEYVWRTYQQEKPLHKEES